MALSPQGVTRDSSPDAAAAEAVLHSAIGKAALRFVPLLTIAYLSISIAPASASPR